MKPRYNIAAPDVPPTIQPLNQRLGIPDWYPINQECPELQFNAQTIEHGYKVRYDTLGVPEAQEGALSLVGTRLASSSIQAARTSIWELLQRLQADRSIKAQQHSSPQGTEISSAQLASIWVCPPVVVKPLALYADWLQALGSSLPLEAVVGREGIQDAAGSLELHAVLRMLATSDVPLPRAAWYLSCLMVNRIRAPSNVSSSTASLYAARSDVLERAFTTALDSVLLDLQRIHQQPPTGTAGNTPLPEDTWLYLLHLLGQLHWQGVLRGVHVTEWVLHRLRVLAPVPDNTAAAAAGPAAGTPPPAVAGEAGALASASVEAVQQYLAAWGGLLPLLHLCCQHLPPSHALRCSIVTLATDLLLAAQRGLPGALHHDASTTLNGVAHLLQQLVCGCPSVLLQLPARVRQVVGTVERTQGSGATDSVHQAALVADALAIDVRSRVVEFRSAKIADQIAGSFDQGSAKVATTVLTRMLPAYPSQEAARVAVVAAAGDHALQGPLLGDGALGADASSCLMVSLQRCYTAKLLMALVHTGMSEEELHRAVQHTLYDKVHNQPLMATTAAPLLPWLWWSGSIDAASYVRYCVVSGRRPITQPEAAAHVVLLQQLPPALVCKIRRQSTTVTYTPHIALAPGTPPSPDVHDKAAQGKAVTAGAGSTDKRAPSTKKRQRAEASGSIRVGKRSRSTTQLPPVDSGYSHAWAKVLAQLNGSAAAAVEGVSEQTGADFVVTTAKGTNADVAGSSGDAASLFLQPVAVAVAKPGAEVPGITNAQRRPVDSLAAVVQTAAAAEANDKVQQMKELLRSLLQHRSHGVNAQQHSTRQEDNDVKGLSLADVLRSVAALQPWQHVVLGAWMTDIAESSSNNKGIVPRGSPAPEGSTDAWLALQEPFEGSLYLLRWMAAWDAIGYHEGAVRQLSKCFSAAGRGTLLQGHQHSWGATGHVPALASSLLLCWLVAQRRRVAQITDAAPALVTCITTAVLSAYPQAPSAAVRAVLEPWATAVSMLLPQVQRPPTQGTAQAAAISPSATALLATQLQAPESSWWVAAVQHASGRLSALASLQYSCPANGAVLSSMVTALAPLKSSAWIQMLQEACVGLVQLAITTQQIWSYCDVIRTWYTSTPQSGLPPSVPQPLAIARAAALGSTLTRAWLDSNQPESTAWRVAVVLVHLTLCTAEEEAREYLEAGVLHSILNPDVGGHSPGPPEAPLSTAPLLLCCLAAGSIRINAAVQGALEGLALLPPGPACDIKAKWLRFLLGVSHESTMSRVPYEVSACLPHLQLSVPAVVLSEVMKLLLKSALSGSHVCLDSLQAITSNAVVRTACCRDAAALMTIFSRDLLVPVRQSRSLLLSRLLSEALVRGRAVSSEDLSGEDVEDKEDGEVGPTPLAPPKAVLQSLLLHVTATTCAASSLLARTCLDQMLYAAALSRGMSQAEAVAAAAASASSMSTARVGEEEKSFTSMVLRSLLQRPSAAEVLASLTLACGAPVMDYLLQQCEWLLQDSKTWSGHDPLSLVLDRRYAHEANAGNVTLKTAVEASASDVPLLAPFAVEEGVVQLTLVCLVSSNAARRREFAQQVINQLGSIATMLHNDSALQAARETQQQRDAAAAVCEGDEGSASGSTGRRTGGFGSGRLRRASGGSSTAVTAGPPAGVHVAVWLRLKLLLPLLPVVYLDKEADPQRNLRVKLASACIRLCHNSVIWSCSQEERPTAAVAGRQEHLQDIQESAAAAAAASAKEMLFDRILHILTAVVSDTWAEWLRGERKLRQPDKLDLTALMPLLEQLPRDMPARLRARLLAAVPCCMHVAATMTGNTQAAKADTNAAASKDPSGAVPCETVLDPWIMSRVGLKGMQLPDKGIKDGDSAKAAWLAGSVQRSRRATLAYE